MFFRIVSFIAFDCSCITCLYLVGPPLALNDSSTRKCIESYSSINVFILIEYYTEHTCAHLFYNLAFFHVFIHNAIFSSIAFKSAEFQGQA